MKATGAGKAFAAGWSVFAFDRHDMRYELTEREAGSRKASAAGRILHRRNPIFVPCLRI